VYKIEKRPSGFLLTFGGFIEKDEMDRWFAESVVVLQGAVAPFGVIIDMRVLQPLRPEVQAVMVEGQKRYMTAGMQRSCVIVANAITAAQFKRLAKESGIYAFERYLDAEQTPDWTKPAVAWVKEGVDPDR
jgi:hypothetical protein